ncbi:hypothetical protein [Geodermatophilus obscurus]|nr:hypothetical protein [Geodermatophilus obscurus]
MTTRTNARGGVLRGVVARARLDDQPGSGERVGVLDGTVRGETTP